MRHRSTRRRRRGFTIVELLIVITILLILIALAAGLSPKVMGSKKMFQATNTVSGALMMAKQRAKRDRLPTGIRLTPPTTAGANTNYIQDLYLIQQPDDLTGGQPGDPKAAQLICQSSSVPANTIDPNAVNPATGQSLMKLGTTVNFSNANFTGPGSGARALVQLGDWLEVNGGGMAHRVVSASANTLQLQLNPDVTCLLGSDNTTNWRIVRQPRALIGEVPLHLQHDVAIDISAGGVGSPTSLNVPFDPLTLYMDILFSPGGALLATGTSPINPNTAQPGDSNIYLYVRDTTESSNFNGDPAVVTVFARSGFVKVSPVNQTAGGDPLSYAKDARGSGQ